MRVVLEPEHLALRAELKEYFDDLVTPERRAGLASATGEFGEAGVYKEVIRQIGTDGNYKSDLPDFMVFLDWKTLPWHWTFSGSFVATLILIVAVPGLIAFVFGFFAFRSRIKGAASAF